LIFFFFLFLLPLFLFYFTVSWRKNGGREKTNEKAREIREFERIGKRMGKGEKNESKGDRDMKIMSRKTRRRRSNKNGKEGAGCMNRDREEGGEEEDC
jgi:hypothetical protein